MVQRRFARAALLVAALYAARQYYRNWGTTKQECQTRLAGDELVADPVVQATEAVWIDAAPPSVWPWLLQLGQDRAGIYSYELLGKLLGVPARNAGHVHPEWQQLAVGDVVRLTPKGWMGRSDGVALSVVEIVPEKHLVLAATRPNLPWDAVWSFHIVPYGDDRSRLLTRARSGLRHPGEVLGMEAARPFAVLMLRATLLGIKHRVERSDFDGQ